MSIHLLPHIFPSRPTPETHSKLETPISLIGNSRSSCLITQKTSSDDTNSPIWCSKLFALALSVALVAPLPSQAIPFLDFKSPARTSPTTPFSQAQKLPTGLENGKIRPCPSINPSCISSNPRSSNFAFPWRILDNSTNGDAAIKQLQDALEKTQKNLKIHLVEDTPNGKYLQAEVDGGFSGRDVLEFLVNGDVVSFRAMATKVTYVYPFTTAFGDSKGQEERILQIVKELGWYAPEALSSLDLDIK